LIEPTTENVPWKLSVLSPQKKIKFHTEVNDIPPMMLKSVLAGSAIPYKFISPAITPTLPNDLNNCKLYLRFGSAWVELLPKKYSEYDELFEDSIQNTKNIQVIDHELVKRFENLRTSFEKSMTEKFNKMSSDLEKKVQDYEKRIDDLTQRMDASSEIAQLSCITSPATQCGYVPWDIHLRLPPEFYDVNGDKVSFKKVGTYAVFANVKLQEHNASETYISIYFNGAEIMRSAMSRKATGYFLNAIAFYAVQVTNPGQYIQIYFSNGHPSYRIQAGQIHNNLLIWQM